MEKEFWTVKEIVELFKIDEEMISTLERDEIISLRAESGKGRILSVSEVDKLRVAKTLMEDMDVNLPGVEVILRMRQNMFDMRRQFDDILRELADELRDALKARS